MSYEELDRVRVIERVIENRQGDLLIRKSTLSHGLILSS